MYDSMTGSSNWVPMGDIAEGYGANRMEATDSLSGREFTLNFEDDSSVRYEFIDGETLKWTVMGGTGGEESAEGSYNATLPREEIYFVDFMKTDEERTSVSLSLDFERGVATAVTATIPSSKEEMPTLLLENAMADESLSAGEYEVRSATIDEPFTDSAELHGRTNELTGKRVKYTYSDNSIYEHIYLNDGCFVWHCLEGEEKDIAEATPCTYYEIADSLYLLVWGEIVLPVIGVILIDLRALKTTGKMLCDDKNDFENAVNIPMGAHAEPLNVTPSIR
ncbi:MoaF C-terminal domain-containing protein [Halococcus hamelinensis]|uniref:MoaF C-terminal domain-containing protein n=1 Tax=Halococcus hamelinensis TaxID=332168 RepID=UPI00135F12E2|nr:MoaF C-terminal domain-containing protein [Halococcus hamelinensis]